MKGLASLSQIVSAFKQKSRQIIEKLFKVSNCPHQMSRATWAQSDCRLIWAVFVGFTVEWQVYVALRYPALHMRRKEQPEQESSMAETSYSDEERKLVDFVEKVTGGRIKQKHRKPRWGP